MTVPDTGRPVVLIATGRVTVEHDNEYRSFRHYTPMLTTLLEATGRFRVRVLEEFRGVGDELPGRRWNRSRRRRRRPPGSWRGVSPRRIWVFMRGSG